MWKKIENIPYQLITGNKMIVVKAINIKPHEGFNGLYTSDPYCVWIQRDGTLARWPHEYKPTHYMEIPSEYEE